MGVKKRATQDQKTREAVSDAQRLESDVLRQLVEASKAASSKDIQALVLSLAKAVSLFESNARFAKAPGNQLPAVIDIIHAARDLVRTIGRPDNDLRELEARAEMLRSLIH